jgi:hypothetical protein
VKCCNILLFCHEKKVIQTGNKFSSGSAKKLNGPGLPASYGTDLDRNTGLRNVIFFWPEKLVLTFFLNIIIAQVISP